MDLHVKSVAVIGGGVSGVSATAHLLKQGLDATLFERSSIAGGVWHFDQRSATDPPFPNTKPSLGDYSRTASGQYAYQTPPATPDSESSVTGVKAAAAATTYESIDKDGADLEVWHAPPGPCYAGLKNNVGLTLMKTSLAEWPEGLEEYVSQRYMEEYIQSIARSTGVDKVARYNTRVEEVTKLPSEGKWRVRTTTLKKGDVAGQTRLRLVEEQALFDAVVVASGHYNMPRVPDIPGLKEWKARFPDRVWHSKRYRSAAALKDKRILLIGAGVSSNDIANEAGAVADKVFQSSRGGDLDLPPNMLPPNALRIGGVKRFILDNPDDDSPGLSPDARIPGRIELANGSELCDIDQVIIATGYITSYPFLPQYHEDDKSPEEANEDTLVTADGDMTHNLHKDIFFIPDPTLAFVGVPYHIATFSFFDFQAQALARVFAGHPKLPTTQAMREEYRQRVAKKGLGRGFHSQRADGAEFGYVQTLVDWVNSGIEGTNQTKMIGHSATFIEKHKAQRAKLQAQGRRLETSSGKNFDHVVVSC